MTLHPGLSDSHYSGKQHKFVRRHRPNIYRPESLCLSGCNIQSFAPLRATELMTLSQRHLRTCCIWPRTWNCSNSPRPRKINQDSSFDWNTDHKWQGRVRLICWVMPPKWTQLSFPLAEHPQSSDQDPCPGHIWHFSTGQCFRILRIPLCFHPPPPAARILNINSLIATIFYQILKY